MIKMKKFRFLSLLLALLMSVTALSGCGETKTHEIEKTGTTNSESTEKTESTDSQEPVSYGSLPNAFTAEKIGSITQNSFYTADGGLYYKGEDGKYGIMTLDGKKDTGAQYLYCRGEKNYFEVILNAPANTDDPSANNCVGLVDVTGKEIVPAEYASISVMNERYAKVIEVTGTTTNEDEALIYAANNESAGLISLSPDDDDTLFKGNWYVYDMIAGKPLKGATGTQRYMISTYGNFVEYVTDEKKKIKVNEKGEALPENANLFKNGCYSLKEDDKGTVYDTNGKKLFSYSLDDFIPYNVDGDYFIARKYEDDTSKFVLMDTSGKIVSAEFTDLPSIYGDLVTVEKKLYDFKGNAVFKETVDSVSFDDQTQNAWLLKQDKKYTLIKKDGTVLFQCTEDDTLSVNSSDFTFRKKVDDKYLLYSFADKDFTIEGGSLSCWLGQASGVDYTYDVVDTLSGKAIITGYKDYENVAISGSVIYVYAQKADGGFDIYTVE